MLVACLMADETACVKGELPGSSFAASVDCIRGCFRNCWLWLSSPRQHFSSGRSSGSAQNPCCCCQLPACCSHRISPGSTRYVTGPSSAYFFSVVDCSHLHAFRLRPSLKWYQRAGQFRRKQSGSDSTATASPTSPTSNPTSAAQSSTTDWRSNQDQSHHLYASGEPLL